MNEALRQLEALLSGAAAVPPRFGANSRYHGVPTRTCAGPDGRPVTYLERRFVPAPQTALTAQLHTVQQGDRLDLLAARAIGDPEQWWKIADANGAMAPEQLTEQPGRVLRIGLPAGLTGPTGGAGS